MGKLIMWNFITLDGYFEGEKNWDLSFHNILWGPELEQMSIEQLNSASHLLFGRVTYEGMAAHWKTEKGTIADLMKSLPKIVVSKTLESADWNNSTIVRNSIPAEIKKLKQASEKDIYVFGSAILSETLIRENLFDEYRIGIAPVLTGKGRHLFAGGISEMQLELRSSRVVATGTALLFYLPKKNG